MDFDAPTLGGAVKAEFLPHLQFTNKMSKYETLPRGDYSCE